ncbi:hypothetical protein EYF80_060785 [Liparis tanakae]|uniref:Uncharacterized protein n=1 Tax=Liparis tanakae TaxID=230148 RepID=A0A4Z2EJM8_9TELE|nr:hypothetical protein EYF80_060785 [Liparis tanakae]
MVPRLFLQKAFCQGDFPSQLRPFEEIHRDQQRVSSTTCECHK